MSGAEGVRGGGGRGFHRFVLVRVLFVALLLLYFDLAPGSRARNLQSIEDEKASRPRPRVIVITITVPSPPAHAR